MPIVAIGDIGVVDGMIHIGDEAMFDEFVTRMRERGADRVIGVSSNPEESATRYGIDAIAQLGFRGLDRAQQRDRLELVRRAASGDAVADDRVLAVVGAIRSSSGVAITGGGNLASTWPANIAERAAIAMIAAICGVPLVVSGQTLGPELTPEDLDSVGALLRSAALVGVREGASFQVATRLGVDAASLEQTVDDASFLGHPGGPTGDHLAVTLSSHLGGIDRETAIHAFASLLDRTVAATGLRLVFVCHFGSLSRDEIRGDAVLHHAVAQRMATSVVHAPVGDSAAAAALARTAALVISSRYHPVVFAVSSGVPAVGISVDGYTAVKLTGALGNFGQASVVPLDEVLRGSDIPFGVWRDRDTIRARSLTVADAAGASSALWWDRVADALGL